MQACDIVLSEYQSLLDPSIDLPETPLALAKPEKQVIIDLLDSAVNLLQNRKALVCMSDPVVIAGDLHGSIVDLIRILRKFPEYQTDTSLLFLGDYVDRGSHSVAVMVLLLALLCKYPSRVFLLRGNHEFAHINEIYGFFDEVMCLYDSKELWCQFQTVFSYFPLAAVIDDHVFCVHGGLSPDLDGLDQISELVLPIDDYFENALVADLVWSDPTEMVPDFESNSRGSGVSFGTRAVKAFLSGCGLKVMVRAHQCVGEGWRTFADHCGVTLFSSSDYCKLQHNRAAVIRVVEDSKLEFTCLTDDPKTVPITMSYGKTLGMRRIVTRSHAEMLLRSRLAGRFIAPKAMVTPKPQRAGPLAPVKRNVIFVDGTEERAESGEGPIPSK
jgi:diadenosine tetraphosphatase ApaH/serine/threonine PP2A family protein phosphatase